MQLPRVATSRKLLGPLSNPDLLIHWLLGYLPPSQVSAVEIVKNLF